MTEKREKIYEGKAKIIYATDNPDLIIQFFKDDATAFNAQKKGVIVNKGVINNAISSKIFSYLEDGGIHTHFVKKLSDREMLAKRLEIIPVEVVVRNVSAGSLSGRMGIDEGIELPLPVLEFYYKSDELGDPMINESHIKAFNLAKEGEMDKIRDVAMDVNKRLKSFFVQRGITLVDFKIEFGRHRGEVLLGDEITPDACRLWDAVTRDKMDKDRFRRDLGGVEDAYLKVYERVCGVKG